ncbi:MAG TPA: hypothetical protein VGJ42_03580 [Nitrososphaera sp.]|jgi:hypothetical protein
MPIVAGIVSTKDPVFSAPDVPKHPPCMMKYAPIKIAGIGALIAGISFMAMDSHLNPLTAAGRDVPKAGRKTGVADAA